MFENLEVKNWYFKNDINKGTQGKILFYSFARSQGF